MNFIIASLPTYCFPEGNGNYTPRMCSPVITSELNQTGRNFDGGKLSISRSLVYTFYDPIK
jgi:hypothetical protein